MFEQFDHCPYHADSWMHNRGNEGLCVKHSKTIRRKDQTLHLLQPIITPDKSTQIEFFVSTKTWNDLKPPKTAYNHLQPPTTTYNHLQPSTTIYNHLKNFNNHLQLPQKHLQPLANCLKPSETRHKCLK